MTTAVKVRTKMLSIYFITLVSRDETFAIMNRYDPLKTFQA